jgi:hypothetical protein
MIERNGTLVHEFSHKQPLPLMADLRCTLETSEQLLKAIYAHALMLTEHEGTEELDAGDVGAVIAVLVDRVREELEALLARAPKLPLKEVA